MSNQEPVIWTDLDIQAAWKAGYTKALDNVLKNLKENLHVHKSNVEMNPHIKNKDLKLVCIVLSQVIEVVEGFNGGRR